MPWILVFLFLTLLELLTDVASMRLADIYWNATNPIFRIDNTDHIIDVNKGNNPFEYDQVNIICPVYSPGTKEEDMERYIIYNVSKEEYDSCRITNPQPRIIAVCDKPHQVMYFTITFRSFTPQPGGLEFRPGQDYYFISTSNGGLNGLHQRIGGRCATHNMKVIFKVCCDPAKVPVSSLVPSTTASSTLAGSADSSTPANFPAASKQPVSKFSHTTSTVAPSVTNPQDKGYNVFGLLPPLPPSNNNNQRSPSINNNNNNNGGGGGRQRPGSSTTPVPPYWLRPYVPTLRTPYKTFEVPSEEKKSNKKTEDRDKLPNETRAKNEELVKNSSAGGGLQAACVWVTTCAVMVATLVSALGR